MRCQNCQFDNHIDVKFCEECGFKLKAYCPKCGNKNVFGMNFCGVCGFNLSDPYPLKDEPKAGSDDERKHVTVLFSDLSGYTAMTERLDPEEVKEIVSRIFGEIAQIVLKYEGFIEKFIGDAVVAIFGVPRSHEDDPIRAIKTAIEVQKMVEQISPKLEEKIGKPLAIHSGINTGLVVTGEVKLDQGTHGLAGDAINIASRLLNIANAGEIVVGHETYRQSEGFFNFETLDATKLKGKSKPLPIYRLISTKDRPLTIRRLSGLKADLIGRNAEMAQLHEAFQKLMEGKGSLISICGGAGTGKSRLVEDFKECLQVENVKVLEWHAYQYSQNISYFPLIDFLNRALMIREADPPSVIREKVQTGVEDLVGKRDHIVPYIGSLYSLSYPEMENISPEEWKYRLQEGVKAIISGLARRMPTIFFLEDLHWADTSFLELLRNALSEVRTPALVICTYRPPFILFKSHQRSAMSGSYQELRLHDLSPLESQNMVASLLKVDSIPSELSRFVKEKVEGNPFYLEEAINSLIESEALIQNDDMWRLHKKISDLEISPSVQGIISARIDRLEKDAKRILQKASVIGRVFHYDILKRITVNEDQIDKWLEQLESLDLIRTRSRHQYIEYVFKHALTQEAVYNGLLKKERQKIHELIGLVMEKRFHHRLPEFYETLAYHFKQGKLANKAVEYLMNSAKKSFSRFAVGESHQYYKDAFELLSQNLTDKKLRDSQIIDLLNEWGLVFIWRGAPAELIDIFRIYEEIAESLEDEEKLGMFYSELGIALCHREQFEDSYEYQYKSLKLGQKVKSLKVVGHACYRLAVVCANLGRLDEAVKYGEQAFHLSEDPNAELPFTRSAWGLINAYWYRGDIKNLSELGEKLLRQGRKISDVRHIAMAEMALGLSLFCRGNYESAIRNLKSALKTSIDPLLIQFSTIFLGYVYIADKQYKEALNVLEKVMRFSEMHSIEFLGTPSLAFRGCALAASGSLDKGLKFIGKAMAVWEKTNRRYGIAVGHIMYGQLYLRIVEGEGPKSIAFIIKNIRSIVRLVPGAARKAEEHLSMATKISGEIGARVLLGQAHLGLGCLYRAKKRTEKARESILEAISIFEKIEANGYLKQSEEVLNSLI